MTDTPTASAQLLKATRAHAPKGQSLPGAPVFATPPDQPQITPAPDAYAETYSDVDRARALRLIVDPDLHYTLYGRQQGRDLLPRITADIRRVVMISPSHLKQCGIGEYGRYLSDELAKQVNDVQVVRSSSAALALGREALEGTLVIVNHGPGLYDGLNPRLSQGESTTRLLQNLDVMKREMGALPLIIHHSLLDTDHALLFSRQQQILNSDIPSIAFISSAGRHFFLPTMELGVSPVPVPKHRYYANRDERPEVVGFFGFFQYGGKDFDSLFHLTRELRGRLVGSVATGNADELKRFEETLENLKLPHDFGSGWVSDTELLKRLKDADYFYLPQNDYDHWNNSATARFVTNLDRPLFLPPHHPFLDMADGSIFADTQDLPRIVAHFREPGHYAQAVARVQAFRERARMSHTATAIRTSLVDRQASVGQELQETPSACSAERCLELNAQDQSLFAQTLGADPARPDSFPALWRAPEGRQYWRKHYELGDLLHGTLLDSLHAIFLAVTKRPITLPELLTLLARPSTTPEDSLPRWSTGEVLRDAMALALEAKGGAFYDPEIVLLDQGVQTDWHSLMTPERIEQFLTEKTARRTRIKSLARSTRGAAPAITNLAEVLLLPTEALRNRPAPLDLGQLDLEYIHAARRPAQRMNRLTAAANAAGLRLGDHLVMDNLLPPAVAPQVHSYVLEDFIYFGGDFFLLNAIRCIDKRDPFGLEMMALTYLLSNRGKLAVLRHLHQRAEGRISIAGLDQAEATGRDVEAEAAEVQSYLDAARDPLAGLIEARNTYEITRRHNSRWWPRMKAETEALWQAAKGETGLLMLLYAALIETDSDRSDPALRRLDPLWEIDRNGRLAPEVEDRDRALTLSVNRTGHDRDTLRITPAIAADLAQAAQGLHLPEPTGAWTNGPEATLLLRLPKDLPDDSVLRATLGFFGAKALSRPRALSVSLRPAGEPSMELLGRDGVPPLGRLDAVIDTDQLTVFDIPLSGLATARRAGRLPQDGVCQLHLAIDRAASPAELGLSDDPRQLGILITALDLGPKDRPTAALSEPVSASQPRIAQSAPEHTD